MSDFKINWDKNKNVRLVEGKSLVFHCHHYNCHLQMSIEGPKYVDGKGIQINAARETAYEHFKGAFSNHKELKSPKQRLAFASKFFQIAGFGIVDFSKVAEKGGIVKCPVSHYVMGWLAKYGKRTSPGDHFTAGWAAGVVAAAYNKDKYTYDVLQTKCGTITGQKNSEFKLEVR